MSRWHDYATYLNPKLQGRTPIESGELRSWAGGWQPDIAEAQLQFDMIPDLLNVEFTEGGGIKKRPGFVIITDDIAGVAEVTSVNVGTSDGGTFTLSYNWPLSDSSLASARTAAIDFDASAAEVEAAIEAMSDDPLTISVTVTGAGTAGDPWIITVVSPIVAYVVTGDGDNLTNGTLTVTQQTQGITAMGTADAFFAKSIEVLEPGSYPRYTQVVLYINEADGTIFYERLGDLLIEEETPGGGSDLQRSGFSLGPWVRANHERPYSVQAVSWGRGLYVTSQRVGGTAGSGTTISTHSGTADHHTQPLHYNADTDVWRSVEPHELDGSTSGFPSARCAISAYDRIFVANIVKQELTGTDYRWRSRIYWSDAGTAETFQANSYITVGSEDDGTDIVNIIKFREQIMIFKEQSVWTLVGTDEDTFALYQLSDSVGAAGTYAVTADETHVYFFDTTQGVMSFDGVNFENVSTAINATLLADLNPAAGFKSVMWADENNTYLSIPNSTYTALATDKPARTYVYRRDMKVWSRWSTAVPCPPVQSRPDGTVNSSNDDLFQNEWYGVYVNVEGIARMHSGINDDGGAIAAYFETAWFNPGHLGDKHRLRRFEVLTSANNDTLDVTLYRNFSTSTFMSGTFTPASSGDGWHLQQANYDGAWWQWLKARIGNDDAGEPMRVDGIGFTFSSRPLLRSELGYFAEGSE